MGCCCSKKEQKNVDAGGTQLNTNLKKKSSRRAPPRMQRAKSSARTRINKELRGASTRRKAMPRKLLAPVTTEGLQKEYETLLSQSANLPQGITHQIEVDLPRTLPMYRPAFGVGGLFIEPLRRILTAYAVLDEEVFYNQGMNAVAGLFLHELAAFSAFKAFMSFFRLNSKVINGAHGGLRLTFIGAHLLEQIMPQLHAHFLSQDPSGSPFLSILMDTLTSFFPKAPLMIRLALLELTMQPGYGVAFMFATWLALMERSSEQFMSKVEKIEFLSTYNDVFCSELPPYTEGEFQDEANNFFNRCQLFMNLSFKRGPFAGHSFPEVIQKLEGIYDSMAQQIGMDFQFQPIFFAGL